MESNYSKYNRNKLLITMLDYTLTDSEKRYITTCLAISRTKRVNTVI